MSTRIRGAVFVLSVITVGVVGGLGVSAIRAPERAQWPDRVAVIGLDDQDPRQPVRFLAVADPVRRGVVVVPPDAVVEIPGSGFLRAYHAYRLGGAPLVRGMHERLFGIDVPFSVTGSGADYATVVRGFSTAEIIAEHLDDLRLALEGSVDQWTVIEVTGERREGPQGSFLVVDPASVSEAARSIGGLGTRVFVDPFGDGPPPAEPVPGEPEPQPEPTAAPPTEIDPSEIAVEVLNGGRVEMAATRTADMLREQGYEIVRISDFTPQTRERSFVYFRDGTEDEARQVGAELGYPVEELPSGITMRATADVLVLLGHDARVT